MQVFTSLLTSGKLSLVYLPNKSSSMPSQALPVGQSLFIGFGLSGIINALCPSAIAAPTPTAKNTWSDSSQPTHMSDLPIDRHFSTAPSTTQNHSLVIQPLAALSDQMPVSMPRKLEVAPPKSRTAIAEDPLCQLILQACNSQAVPAEYGDITINIDATGATETGELAATGTDELAITNSAEPEQALPQTAQEIIGDQDAEPSNLPSVIADAPNRNSQPQLDDELGTIRAKPIKIRQDEDLGILRLLQTAAPPPKPKRPSGFITARLGYIDSENAFRLDSRSSEQTYQSGLAFKAFPTLSDKTSLYAIAETNLGRFERAGRRGYNEVELQLGVRQKLAPRTYAQLGLRNQRFYSFGYERQILGIYYIDTSLSHRSILNDKTSLDSFYQARLGFADRESSSRFRQTLTTSLNYAATKDLRASLLYQLTLEDYTQISRYDIYHQVIGTVSYRLTPESKITLFGGTRFGDSSGSSPIVSRINLDDTFYGAELTVNLPLF